MWFTRKDVQAQLLALGYDNVPENVLDSFVAGKETFMVFLGFGNVSVILGTTNIYGWC